MRSRRCPGHCLETAALLVLVACGGGATQEAPGFESFAGAPAIVAGFADDVVVATYAVLAERLTLLEASVQALATDRSEASLQAAQEAWLAGREPWEASEAFLFGPVGSLGLDPALDSWPVDRTALDSVLAGGDTLSESYVANLDPTLRGFHTAEYLLFGVGGTRAVAELGDRELAYLLAVTALLVDDGEALAASWTTDAGGGQPYAALFKGAGSNSTYPSLTSAAEEIVRGMIGIADEVANGKLADPFDQRDPALVESQFSLNSLTDFANNLRSVRHAYTGAVPFAGTDAPGLDAYVTAMAPALDARLKRELDAAIAALEAIPEPFSAAIVDPGSAAAITAAQEAVRAVQTTLEQEILPLVL